MYDRPRVGGWDLKIIQFKQNIFSRRRSKLVDQTDNLFPVSKNVLFNKILFFTALQTFPFYIAAYVLYQTLTSNCTLQLQHGILGSFVVDALPLHLTSSASLLILHFPLGPRILHSPLPPAYTHRDTPNTPTAKSRNASKY